MTIETKQDPTLTPLVPPKVLAGLIAGEVGAQDIGSHERASAVGEVPPAPSPRTDDEIRASIVARLQPFDRGNLLVVEWVLSRLPFDFLVELCRRETRRGVEPHGKTVVMPPTPAVVAAQATLLSALDMIRPLVGLAARVRAGTGIYLRPTGCAAAEAEKASGQ